MLKLSTVTFVASLLSSVTSAQSVWVAPASQKIRPGDAAGSATTVALEAAANEFEAFHLIVAGGAGGARAITVAADKLVGPGGAVIDDVRVFREGWYNVATPSNVQGATGRWPDAMIPAVDDVDNQPRNAFPWNVPAGEQQPIFVEYHVPSTAAPGWYAGTVHVSGGASAEVPVKLYVHGFALPSTSSLRVAYGIGWDDPCTAHYGGYSQCGGDAGVQAMLNKYTRFALDHRISLSEVVYNGPRQNPDGSFDWASWDAVYGPMLDGGMGGRLVGAKLTSMRFMWNVDQAHFSAWAQHFKAKGWLDRTFDYTCDEPPNGCAWSAIAPRAAMVHAADPNFETLVTTSYASAQANGVAASIDTLVGSDTLLDPRPPAANTRAAYDPFLAQSPQKRVWIYQSCDSDGCNGIGPVELTGWPSHLIDAPATQNRAMEWQAWRQRVSGELYYDTTYAFARGDAWSSQYYFGGNGDGTLFYPGTPAKIGGTSQIPVASLRVKMIREGLEDYEYLKLLAEVGDPAMADAEAAALSPHAWQNETDPAAIDAARHRIALRIEALTGKTVPPMGGTGGNGGGGGSGGASGGGDPPAGTGGNGATPTVLKSPSHGGCSLGGAPAVTPLSLALLGAVALLRARRRSRR